MLIDVKFQETGIVKTFDLDDEPVINDVIRLNDGGREEAFWVVSVSGRIYERNTTVPTSITVKRADP
ncbi:hypothetical protein [Atlantibacter hermannii]|uniref:hypothetical protein n=1 Tax=Atlantibacter hermannii TaxID=565 RepID=UPI0028B13BB2|nr:hypothetical protein [Atlantibacter hermannii]